MALSSEILKKIQQDTENKRKGTKNESKPSDKGSSTPSTKNTNGYSNGSFSLEEKIAKDLAAKKAGASSTETNRLGYSLASVDREMGKQGYSRYLTDKKKEEQAKQKEVEDEKWWESVFRYMGSSPDTTLPMHQVPIAVDALREDTSWKEPTDEWNDEERDMFGFIYVNKGKKEAEAWAAKLNDAINKAKKDEERKAIVEKATSSTGNAVVATGGAVLKSTLGGADFLMDLAEGIARGQITERDYLSPFEQSQAVTEGVATHLNDKYGTIDEDVAIIGGKGWGDVYGLGTSIAQSSLAAYTGGAPQALIQFFGSAAAAGVDDARARGASDDQAIVTGVINGLAEAIPEAMGIDNLLKIGSSDTIKSLIKNILKQSVAEGMEEGATSIINNVADNLVMGDLSNFNMMVQEYVANGMSEEEAKKKAWRETVEGIVYDSLAGFASGGIHAGPQTAWQTFSANSNAKATYGDSVTELIEEGLSTAPGTRSHELAAEYRAKLDQGKTLSGAEIRMMVEANEQQFTTEDTAKIQEAAENRLRELGESDNVAAIAQILAKQAGGETITKGQQRILDKSQYGQRVSNELNPQNIRTGGYASDWTGNIGTEKINADLYNLARETAGISENAPQETQEAERAKVQPSEMSSAPKAEKATQNEYKVSDSGKTISNVTGAEANIAEIASIKNGKMVLKLDNGEEVGAENVSFGSQDEALIYEAVANLDNINAPSANILVKNMDLSDVSPEVYARGIEEAYRFGTYSYPVSEMMREGSFAADLSEQQRMQAYNLGKSNHKAATQAKEATVRKNRAIADKKEAVAGKVHYDKTRAYNDRQKVSIEVLERISGALGIEFYLFESPVVNGRRQGANGWFDPKDGSIHIDIFAGQNGEGTMLFTAAHELTHFIKKWSPAKFDILADFLMEEYGKKGVSVEELVRAQQEKARRNGREISYDVAFEEVVADSMETMLADGKVTEKLAKLKVKDQTLWEKIKDFIADLVKKIKEVYKGLTPNSEEGQYVAEMKDSLERIQQLFTEGVVEAAENFQTIGSIDLENFADAKTTDGEQLFQYRAMEADEDTYVSMLKKWGKFSDAQINNLFTTIDKAMDIIKDNLEILDYAWEADINDRAFSPVKPNSDSLYQVSIDFSTLCRKRLLQQTVQAQLQEALNRPMTREEGIAIRDALMAVQEEGRQIEIACALCYVESARMKSPAQIMKFLENREAVLKDFFASKSGGDTKAKIKEAELEARERLGVGDASLKSLSNKVAAEIRAAKKEAKASYKPTAEEQKLIDAAMKMTVSDFTTPVGLENLAKNYRGIFDGYTSYVRNATKSKGIENDTWWRAGDSASIGDTLIANMNRENGLRSQSWSDFQVIHMMDYIAAVIELSTRNSKMQAYTKVPDYVELMGNTGVMINLSLIPTRNYLGSLDYDSTEGMDYRKSLELRDKYHGTVGTICIGIDNNQIKQLFEDMTIDYVIPYHKSGMAAHIRKAMHLPTWAEYELYQSESNLSDAEAKKNAEKYGVKLLDKSDLNYHKHTSFSKWFDLKEAQQIAKMENANPSDPAKQKKYGVMYGGYMAMQNAANNYLKLCAERGLAPVFSHKKADFTGEDNYWKVLIDRKMVDNITGEVIEQKAIQPIFDKAEVLRILNDELERYPKVKADQEYAIRRVTEKFLSGEIKGGMSSEAVAKAMQKPVDNISTTNIVEASKEMDEVKLSDRDSDIDIDTRINMTRTWIDNIEDRLSDPFFEEENPKVANELRAKLESLYRDLRGELAEVRKQTKKTSLKTILENLEYYSDLDIEGLANDISENNWDFKEEGLSRAEIIEGIREMLEEKMEDMSPLEQQSPKFGFYVRHVNKSEDIRYSLREVDPVQPASDKWQRTSTTSEVMARFPDLWNVAAEESEVRNPTQITGTVRSYRKIYDFLKNERFNGKILDASSGLGYGTRAGIEEYGFDVEDIEPYPDKSYHPKYKDYSKLNKKYDAIISNAVLNVIPQDQRDALVVKMGELLNEGGRMFINVRGKDVENASSKVAINSDLMEYYISNTGSYQKGFTKDELVAYLQDALGDGFTVEKSNMFGAVSAVVTKKQRTFSYDELINKKDLDVAMIDNTQQVKLNPDGSIDGKWIVGEVKKQCNTVKTNAPGLTYYLSVPDIGENVEITNEGITHGFIKTGKKTGNPPPRSLDNARAVLGLPEILKNSVEVNRSQRSGNAAVPYSHVMMGVVAMQDGNGKYEFYSVRSVIEERINQDPILVEFNILGKLHSVNAKKIGLPRVQASGKAGSSLAHSTTYTYKVADLLDDVKSDFDDTFSEDVYNHFGLTRHADLFSNNLLYQDRIGIADRNRAVILQNKAERLEKELADLERAYKKAQDYARAEGVLAGQIEQGAQMAKELRQKQESFNRKVEGYEKTISDKRKKIAEIRAKRDELLAKAKEEKVEAVAKARQKAAETQREIITRYQESRKKAVEGRNQTEMRHKIKGVVSELNQLLLHGTKDRHVMVGLQKAVADALDVVNMDTIGAEERIAKYDALIAKANDPDVIASLTATRDRIRQQGENLAEKIAQLKAGYGEIKNSDDPLIANGYDEVIASKIDSVVSTVGNTPLRAMSMEQLEDVYDMYKMVLTRIREANRSFKMAKNETISALGNRTMMEVEQVGGKHPYRLKGADKIGSFSWNNDKPVYALERIGSKTFTEVFNNVRAGEDIWARDVSEARSFFKQESQKYHYDKWDMKRTFSFKSKTGQNFKLTLPQIMSLYAYSKRKQADKHLELGGFVFDSNIEVVEKKHGIPVKYKVNTATAHNISREILSEIVGKLSAEQKAFVDEMQEYLSSTMGEKGNEVSLAMYGVKLFKEKNYFPLKSAKQFMFEQNETAGEVRIKNSGFSKETVVNASNPVILANFMDVWGNHVNDMSMYHAFVLPLEDFNRVFNYKTPTSDSMDTESVKQFIQNAYGEEANTYISELIKDLNGGARVDQTAGIMNKLIGGFKKAAVFASASVVVQQPSAIVRAHAVIDSKYFLGLPKIESHKKLWEEVKKYAPVAIIKEMGYFDTNMGRSTVDYIKDEKTLGSRMDDFFSWAPAYADEATWGAIWNAVKRETKAKNPNLNSKSEEFLKIVGERFTEVVTKTQVYDSVLARSANMRSKDTGMKMATAFMAEPTTSINMLEDAVRQWKRGHKKQAVNIISAVYGSVILNAVLVSLVYAARDDDEDENYLEKYIGSLTTEIIDGMNPLTYIPFIKDIWSIAQGFDVERADMSLATKLIEAFEKASTTVFKDTSDMDEEELAQHNKEVNEAIWGIVDYIAALFGQPVKNIRRDLGAAKNIYYTIMRGQKGSMGSIFDQIIDSAKNAVPVWGWFPDESKGDKLYNAIIHGDSTYAGRLEGGFKSESSRNSALRGALRDNDPRIREAALARINGNPAEYKRLAKEIIADGFLQDDVVLAINSEINAINKGETEASSGSKAIGFFKVDDYIAALEGRDQAAAQAVKNDIISTAMANGKDLDDAEKSFTSSFKSAVWDAYEEGELSQSQVANMLTNYADMDEEEIDLKFQVYEWKASVPGADDITASAIADYNEFAEPAGIGKADYYKAWRIYTDTDADIDPKTGEGIAYSKVKKVMPQIDVLPLTPAQKTALALCWWAESTVRKYKTW